MGNSPSAEEKECVGYRVLGVLPKSPASSSGLVSFFDFIIAANGAPLKRLDNTIIEMIMASEDKPLPITVYNYKSQQVRDVTITPTRNWGGQGMLGVTIRFDTYYAADENLVRVLAVAPNSPAQLAGLTAGADYLLGTAEKVFKNPDILGEELERHLEQPMEVYVYSTETDEVRVVVLLPSLEWGGNGCLGAEVGHGYLHRLPSHCKGSTGTSVGVGITINSVTRPPPPLPLDYDPVTALHTTTTTATAISSKGQSGTSTLTSVSNVQPVSPKVNPNSNPRVVDTLPPAPLRQSPPSISQQHQQSAQTHTHTNVSTDIQPNQVSSNKQISSGPPPPAVIGQRLANEPKKLMMTGGAGGTGYYERVGEGGVIDVDLTSSAPRQAQRQAAATTRD